MTAHCEWCPFPGCDSCAYNGHERVVLLAAKPTSITLRRNGFRECLGVRTNACPSTLGPQLKRPPLVRQHQEFGGLTPTKEGL